MNQRATKEKDETLYLITMRNALVKAYGDFTNIITLKDSFSISDDISKFVVEKCPTLGPEMLKLLQKIDNLKKIRILIENQLIFGKVTKYTSSYICLKYVYDGNTMLKTSKISALKQKENIVLLQKLENSVAVLRSKLGGNEAGVTGLDIYLNGVHRDSSEVSELLSRIILETNDLGIKRELALIRAKLETFTELAKEEKWGFNELQKEVKSFYLKVISSIDSTYPKIVEGSNWTIRLGILLFVMILASVCMIPLSKTSTFKEYFSVETTQTLLNPSVAPNCSQSFGYIREDGLQDEISFTCIQKHPSLPGECYYPKSTNQSSFTDIAAFTSFYTGIWSATATFLNQGITFVMAFFNKKQELETLDHGSYFRISDGVLLVLCFVTFVVLIVVGYSTNLYWVIASPDKVLFAIVWVMFSMFVIVYLLVFRGDTIARWALRKFSKQSNSVLPMN